MHPVLGSVLAVAAVLTAIGVIVKSPITRWVGNRLVARPIDEALAEHLDPLIEARLVPVQAKLELIHAQLIPNGGTSVPDRLGRIEDRIDRLEDRQAGVDAVIDSVLKQRRERP